MNDIGADLSVAYNDGYEAGLKAKQKTGHWEPLEFPWFQCSECGAIRNQELFLENYCPYCGAKMEEQA